MRYFKLNADGSHSEVSEAAHFQWKASIFGTPVCSIGRTPLADTIVSTVFLGICKDDEELPYQTMVYATGETIDYATRQEAVDGHAQKVKELSNKITV